MSELVWEDPPPARSPGCTGKGKWQQVLAEVAERPGEWARVLEGVSKKDAEQAYRAFRWNGAEGAVRKVDGAGYSVWARVQDAGG